MALLTESQKRIHTIFSLSIRFLAVVFLGTVAYGGGLLYYQTQVVGTYSTNTISPRSILAAVSVNTPLSYTLPADAVTSAGVYEKSSGALVRTLWNAVSKTAGNNTLTWDGKDDSGTAVSGTASDYEVRILYHNVSYTWDGVIGNTSDALTGSTVLRGAEPFNDMTIDASWNASVAMGYNEGQDLGYRMNAHDGQYQKKSAWNRQTLCGTNNADPTRSFRYVATDGQTVYYANTGNAFDQTNFVMGYVVSTGAEKTFSSGSRATGIYNDNCDSEVWHSVINQTTATTTGLAVQKTGNNLFVAQGAENTVLILNKNTGAVTGSITMNNPGRMAVDSNDNLWVIAENASHIPVIYKYTGITSTTGTRAVTITTGVGTPVAIGVDPTDDSIAIVDIGNQQVKGFSSTGTYQWSYGEFGGMPALGPDVTTTRFWFDSTRAFIAFRPDGSFFVEDGNNYRTLLISSNHTYLDQIVYLGTMYLSTVDENDPTRVFAHWLEFSVDYSKPIQQSWSLVKNWRAGAPSDLVSENGFAQIFTLSNSRTYGFVFHSDSGHVGGGYHVLELPSSGALVSTGQVLYDARSAIGYGPVGSIHADGAWYYPLENNYPNTSTSQRVMKRALTGFTSGVPQWGTATSIAQVSISSTADPYDRGGFNGSTGARLPITDDQHVIFFNPYKDTGMHLGAALLGGDWSWKSSPSGIWDTDGSGFPTHLDGKFDVSTAVQYAGNAVMASGNSIIYGYHGEMWGGGQANQWLHFYDNGLFIGQFGTANITATGTNAPAGSAGNAFSPTLVTYGGNTYLWHNDENAHSGIHRWKINNLSSIQTLTVQVDGGSSSGLAITILSPQTGTSVAVNTPITLSAQVTDGGNVVFNIPHRVDNNLAAVSENTSGAPVDSSITHLFAFSVMITTLALFAIIFVRAKPIHHTQP